MHIVLCYTLRTTETTDKRTRTMKELERCFFENETRDGGLGTIMLIGMMDADDLAKWSKAAMEEDDLFWCWPNGSITVWQAMDIVASAERKVYFERKAAAAEEIDTDSAGYNAWGDYYA